MDAKEFLESIGCFNIIFANRDKDSNTLAKILEAYATQSKPDVSDEVKQLKQEISMCHTTISSLYKQLEDVKH